MCYMFALVSQRVLSLGRTREGKPPTHESLDKNKKEREMTK